MQALLWGVSEQGRLDLGLTFKYLKSDYLTLNESALTKYLSSGKGAKLASTSTHPAASPSPECDDTPPVEWL